MIRGCKDRWRQKRSMHPDYTVFLNENGLSEKHIGYHTAFRGIDYKVDARMDSAVAFMRSQGARITEIENILADSTEHYSFEVDALREV
ncbi:MAG: hypothetical protein U5N26_03105 [Candidatus Marinimicrobia bacterium]|nr:hypothetical protein [Candidatus Neomarinimicrobiota bacterium]